MTAAKLVTSPARVVGVDISLRSTGVACPAGVDRIRSEGRANATIVERQRRLHTVRNAILEWCRGAALVVVEGPSYGSNNHGHFDVAGLHWLVLDRLIANGIPVAVMPPASRAKYATGKGNAGKDEVLASVLRRFPGFDVTGHDEADALTLMAAGLDHLGQPLVVLPDRNREALGSTAWPEVGP